MGINYQTIIEHYEQCLARHGDSHLGVDWPNAADAQTRYRVMLEVIRTPLSEPLTLLDFGCGAAHLYDHLNRSGRADIRYVGVDASARFIELASRKFPACEFHCIDVLAEDIPLPPADYIVMNGVLTEKRRLSVEQMHSYMWRLLTRVFAFARIGLAFNVMSHHVDWQRDDLNHV